MTLLFFRRYIKIGTVCLLFGIAVTYGGQASYMAAKAELAQWLLLRAWNQGQLSKEATVPWPWADTYPVALLEISALGVEQVVLDSHSGEAMAFGPGLVSVGGSYVLGGHRDSHFEFLQEVEIGQLVSLQQLSGELQEYEVSDLLVVDSREGGEYLPPGESLSLITCYPFDSMNVGGPLRYVVVGSLVGEEV